MRIEVDANPSEEKIAKLGCRSWSIWSKEISKFSWHYEDQETCLIIEGEVTVTPDKVTSETGDAVTFGAGTLVIFPRGMSCTWEVTKPVRKYYKFGD